ncbi:MAG: hypothetical protein ACI9IA_002180, partial [Enterobacterales bacterium]
MSSNKCISLKVIIVLSGLSIILLSGCISSHYDTENEPKTVKGLLAKTDRLIKQQR